MNAFVYMMVADLGTDHRYCKIGFTGDLKKRICGVQIGCPVPISDIAYVRVRNTSQAYQIEQMIHYGLREFRSQGEWFRLDFSNPEHKSIFGRVTEDVFSRLMGSGWRWVHMDIEAIQYVDVAACV
jgi:hypothetical protein